MSSRFDTDAHFGNLLGQIPPRHSGTVACFQGLRVTHPDLQGKRGGEILVLAREHCMAVRVFPKGSSAALQHGHLLTYLQHLERSSGM